MADAATRPALAAVIPSSEARTALYFFKLLQIRITKNIRKVPGRKIPIDDMIAPVSVPAIPKSREDNAPMYAANENNGPGKA